MPQGEARPIDPGIVARVVQGVRYIATGQPPDGWFGPSAAPAPLAPATVAGRQFDFPVGYNLQTAPRAGEASSFADLRALADGWDVLRLVIETRKDQLEKLDWNLRPRAPSPRGQAEPGAHNPRIAALEAFLRMPDREHGWGTWLRMLLEDLFVIDAPTLYVRRNRAGDVVALEVVDGATIKRVLDEHGRTPLPPEPAYQQVLKGLPAVNYGLDELIYQPRNLRAHKVYGTSPVEQIVLTVNIALRRQLAQLQYYTEGNVPEALIGVPDTWSADQIRQFQDYWDALLEGNTAARRHAKFVPGGLSFTPTRAPSLQDEMDEWLARIACYAFSVSPAPFVRMMNRATAGTVHQAALEEGLAPIQNWVKQLIDRVLAEHLDAADLQFAWRDDSGEDPMQAAQIAQIYVSAGIKSANEVRAELGLAPLPGANALAAPNPPTPALGKYSPGQPHVPAGQPGAGQWAGGGDDGQPLIELANRRRVSLPSKPPAYRQHSISRGDWKRITAAIDGHRPALGDNERATFARIFAAEGGLRKDPDSTAASGILDGTLKEAQKSGKVPGIAGVNHASDLSSAQRVSVYKYVLDRELRGVGGSKALNKIGDADSAAAFVDTLFRHGGAGGRKLIGQAVNYTIDGLSDEERQRLGVSKIPEGGASKTTTYEVYKALANGGHGRELRANLAVQRKADPNTKSTEYERIDSFR